jgi:hypothetical protein
MFWKIYIQPISLHPPIRSDLQWRKFKIGLDNRSNPNWYARLPEKKYPLEKIVYFIMNPNMHCSNQLVMIRSQ